MRLGKHTLSSSVNYIKDHASLTYSVQTFTGNIQYFFYCPPPHKSQFQRLSVGYLVSLKLFSSSLKKLEGSSLATK